MISDEDIKKIVEQVTLNLERKLIYKKARLLIRKLYKKLIKYKYVPREQTVSSIYEIDDIVVELENCITDDYYTDEMLNVKMMLNNDLDYLYLLGLEDAEREIGLNHGDIKENNSNDLPYNIDDLMNKDKIYDFIVHYALSFEAKIELKRRGYL